MPNRYKRIWRNILLAALAVIAFVVVAIVIPLWIRSQRPQAQTVTGLSQQDISRNATKLAHQATAVAFPTSQVIIKGVKPLDAGESTVTPEATAFTPIAGAQTAGDGAIVEIQPPFPAALYRIANAWYYDDPSGTLRTFVWAGSITGQGTSEPGIVIVQVYQRGDMSLQPETTVYEAPAGAEALRVVSAQGMTLTLQSADGQTLYFNVLTRTFNQ